MSNIERIAKERFDGSISETIRYLGYKYGKDRLIQEYETASDEERRMIDAYLKKNFTGGIVINPSNQTQTKEKKKKSGLATFFTVIGIMLLFALYMFTATVIFMVSYTLGGAVAGIVSLDVMILLTGLIFKKHFKRFGRFVMWILGLGAWLSFCIIAGNHGFPEFVRKIPGKYFLVVWPVLAVLSQIIVYLIVLGINNKLFYKFEKEISGKKITHREIMSKKSVLSY